MSKSTKPAEINPENQNKETKNNKKADKAPVPEISESQQKTLASLADKHMEVMRPFYEKVLANIAEFGSMEHPESSQAKQYFFVPQKPDKDAYFMPIADDNYIRFAASTSVIQHKSNIWVTEFNVKNNVKQNATATTFGYVDKDTNEIKEYKAYNIEDVVDTSKLPGFNPENIPASTANCSQDFDKLAELATAKYSYAVADHERYANKALIASAKKRDAAKLFEALADKCDCFSFNNSLNEKSPIRIQAIIDAKTDEERSVISEALGNLTAHILLKQNNISIPYGKGNVDHLLSQEQLGVLKKHPELFTASAEASTKIHAKYKKSLQEARNSIRQAAKFIANSQTAAKYFSQDIVRIQTRQIAEGISQTQISENLSKIATAIPSAIRDEFTAYAQKNPAQQQAAGIGGRTK